MSVPNISIEPGNRFETDDSKIAHLNYLIDEKKEYLMNKYHTTHKLVKQNEFLEGVLRDYTQYRDVIIAQKQQHIMALETIYSHVNQVKKTNELSKSAAREHTREQKNIVDELNIVKAELDKIVQTIDEPTV